MTVAKAVAFQGDIYTTVSGAITSFGLTAYDHPPADPIPAEFVRLDGFEASTQHFKTEEQARHAFEVHHFDRPVGAGATRNRRIRSKTVLAAIHAALMASRPQGERLRHEYMTVSTDEDGVTAHGVSRYTVVIR